MIVLGLGLTLTVFAGGPKVVSGGRIGSGASKVIVVRPHAYYSRGFGYSPFYSPFYSYNPFYLPFAYRQQEQPSKLDLAIEEVNNDFHHDIADVRHDKSLSTGERKQKIRDLRREKDNSIVDAKKDYYNSEDRRDDNTISVD